MGAAIKIPCVPTMVRASKEYGASPTMWLSGLKDRCYALTNQDIDDSLFMNKEEMDEMLGLPTIGTHPSERYVSCLMPITKDSKLMVPRTVEALHSCSNDPSQWEVPKWPTVLAACQGEQAKRYPGVIHSVIGMYQHLCVPVIWRLQDRSARRWGVMAYDLPYIYGGRQEKDVLVYRSREYADAFSGAAAQAIATYMLYTAEHCNV